MLDFLATRWRNPFGWDVFLYMYTVLYTWDNERTFLLYFAGRVLKEIGWWNFDCLTNKWYMYWGQMLCVHLSSIPYIVPYTLHSRLGSIFHKSFLIADQVQTHCPKNNLNYQTTLSKKRISKLHCPKNNLNLQNKLSQK